MKLKFILLTILVWAGIQQVSAQKQGTKKRTNSEVQPAIIDSVKWRAELQGLSFFWFPVFEQKLAECLPMQVLSVK